MREAIGGSWLLGFVVLFIVLFSSYLAISINYSKAFKVKNQIINIIEKSEGFTESATQNLGSLSIEELKKDSSTEAKVLVTLKELGYFTAENFLCGENQGEYKVGGYCLNKIVASGGNYYKVTTFIKFDIPLVKISIKIPINGETKTIFFDKSK